MSLFQAVFSQTRTAVSGASAGGGGCGCGCGGSGGCLGGRGGGCGCAGSFGSAKPESGALSRYSDLTRVAGNPSIQFAPSVLASLHDSESFSSVGSSLPGIYYLGGSGDGLASILCAAYREQEAELLQRINERRRAYSTAVADQLRDLWAQARRFCRASETDMSVLCQQLSAAAAAASAAGDGRAFSSLHDLATKCSCGLQNVLSCNGAAPFRNTPQDLLTAQFFACLATRRAARTLEQRDSQNRGASPQWSYEYDIAPLEEELLRIRALLRRCTFQGPAGRAACPECADSDPVRCRNCCAFLCEDSYSDCTTQCDPYR